MWKEVVVFRFFYFLDFLLAKLPGVVLPKIFFLLVFVVPLVVLPEKLVVLADAFGSEVFLLHLVVLGGFVGEEAGEGEEFSFGDVF